MSNRADVIVEAYYIVGVAVGLIVSTLMSTNLVRCIVAVGLVLLALGIFIGTKGEDT